MTSIVNKVEALPLCNDCSSTKKQNCVCTACHDEYHFCLHARNPTPYPKPAPFEDKTTYLEHYGVERVWHRPPRLILQPSHNVIGPCGPVHADPRTSYQSQFTNKGTPTERPYESSLVRPGACKMKMTTSYNDAYNSKSVKTKNDIHEDYLEDQAKMFKAMHTKPIESFQRHPPRPYDYAKFDKYVKRGMLFLPQDLILARRLQAEEDSKPSFPRLNRFHSDLAPTYYQTSTETKDAYVAGLDLQKSICCRPESRYHADRLQTCIVCHEETGKEHPATCKLRLYGKPARENRYVPYQGPTPAINESTAYKSSYQSPQESSFLIPEPTDPPCQRLPCHPPVHCPAFARNLPLGPLSAGHERCNDSSEN